MKEALRSKIHLAVIAAMVVLTFLPGLRAEFLNWDDQTHLTENQSVQTFDVKAMFTQTVQKIYIPLTSLSFAVERRLFGSGPFVHHLDNLLLHLANTVLIYFLVQRLGATMSVAFWAALLFGVHPMRVESVVWVTERKDLLYTFFYLLALHQYWSYLAHRRLSSYGASMGFGILSLLAKPMALSLPLVLCLLDWFRGRSFDRRAIVDKIPFLAFVIPITWITYALHARNPIADALEAVLIWTYTFNFYIWKFLWPATLVPVYHIPEPVGLNNPAYLCSFLFFIALIVVTVHFRSRRWWVFAVGYYAVSIFFLMRFDAAKDINVVADRFMYLPSLGFCILFGLGIEKVLDWCAKKKKEYRLEAFAIFCTVILIVCFKSIDQIRVWNNTNSLWTYVIKHNPTEFLAYNDRAVDYIQRGFYDLGIADYTAILKFDPGNEDAHYNRGLAYEKIGRYQAAIYDFNEVIRQFPYYEKAYLHRGMSYEKMGDDAAALDDYNRTIAVSPDFPDGYLNRGNIYNKQEKLNAALADYNRVVSLNPRSERAINNRGVIYAKLSDDKRALEDFSAALAMDPRHAEAYYNRAVIYVRMNKRAEALADVLKAEELGIRLSEGFFEGLR
jgi:protein O-mannosyl-transferase